MAGLRGKSYVLIENYGIFFHKIGVHMIFCLKIDHFWKGPPSTTSPLQELEGGAHSAPNFYYLHT